MARTRPVEARIREAVAHQCVGHSPGGKVVKGFHDLAGHPGFDRNRDTDALFQSRE